MKIDISLNSRDLRDTINKLQWYKSHLQWKLEVFVSELADVGIKVARENTYVEYDERYINMGDLLDFSKDITSGEDGTVCTLTVTGQVYTKEWQNGSAQVNPLLMAEFGSGSKAIDGHRGTFPNQHVAFLNRWHWTDNSGTYHESDGSEPSRPLFKAVEEMTIQIQSVAAKVFGT